jgi:signal peptidase I
VAGARDYAYIALAVGVVFGALYLLTGTWPPVMTVQSNSMMHVNATEYNAGQGDTRNANVSFGRPGTIDPGDMVLVDEVDGPEDIQTFANASDGSYGKDGDVLVFKRTGTGPDLTVIHRAMSYVETDGEGRNRTYTVQWTDEWLLPPEELATCSREPTFTCTFDERGVFLPELGIYECPAGGPARSGGLGGDRCPNPTPKPFLGPGFITKGDNDATNPGADQAPTGRGESALNPQPVAMEQVVGVAHGEIPALGVLKVAFSGTQIHNADIQGHDYYLRLGNMVAPVDIWVLALAEVGVLSATPLATTIVRQWWNGRDEERVPELDALRRAAHPPREGS